MADGAFAAHVGATLGEYVAFRRAWQQGRGQGGQPEGGGRPLDIPWLPEGMDVAALVLESSPNASSEGGA